MKLLMFGMFIIEKEYELSGFKYHNVKESIKANIRNGVWSSGDKIPSQRELEEQLEVSRITVKKAIIDLMTEGELERLPGRKGLFVKQKADSLPQAKLIGVAIDDVRDAFGATILRGIEDYLWDRKYHAVVCNIDRNFDKIEQYFHSLLQQQIAGVIFSPVIDRGYVENNTKIISLLKNNNLPFVLIDRYVPDILTNYVVPGHREGSRQLTEQLLKNGHKRILIIKGLYCTGMNDRVRGYLDAHEEAGVTCDENLILQVNDNLLYPKTDPAEVARMKELMRKAGDFTVFYALNGRILKSGIDVLLSMDMKIGQQVQLALFDAISKPFPPYTDNILHVVQPSYQIGREAAKVLLEHIKEPEKGIVQVVLNSRMVPVKEETIQ
ncbi:MAG: GntR family transcriptional regulator [bacterium]|nr:GntR family transcriptional regulator [bacterium]